MFHSSNRTRPAFLNHVILIADLFQGDEKVRSALFKLRQTWKGIFSESKLYLVDISTKRMDPQWPITTSTGGVHLNPKFFLRPTNGVQEVRIRRVCIQFELLSPIPNRSLSECIHAFHTSQQKYSLSQQKISQSMSEDDDIEKSSRRLAEDLHKADGEHTNILRANTDSEKRPDPRLKKVITLS